MAYKASYWSKKEKNRAKAREHEIRMEEDYSVQIDSSVERSRIIEPDDLEFSSRDKEPIIEFVMTTSEEAAATVGKGIRAVLNFASFKNPGGMFLEGSSAQEESLCHASTLYNVLERFNDTYYAQNRRMLNRSLYQNRLLYSPDILFEYGDKKAFCDVITLAAPNKSAAQRYCNVTDEENRQVLRERIYFLLKTISMMDVDYLILGAWGCGVFGQSLGETAELFQEAIKNVNCSLPSRIVFAIPDSRTMEKFKRNFLKGVN